MKKKCFDCSGDLEKFQDVRKGVGYEAYRCTRCGEVVFDMAQAESYLRAAEKSKEGTFSKWGQSLAVRIPKELVQALHLKPKQKAKFLPDKHGFRVVPVSS